MSFLFLWCFPRGMCQAGLCGLGSNMIILALFRHLCSFSLVVRRTEERGMRAWKACRPSGRGCVPCCLGIHYKKLHSSGKAGCIIGQQCLCVGFLRVHEMCLCMLGRGKWGEEKICIFKRDCMPLRFFLRRRYREKWLKAMNTKYAWESESIFFF